LRSVRLLVSGEAFGVGHRAVVGSVGVSDVSNSGNIGPVFGKDSLAPVVPFDLPASGPAGSLEAEVDAADACEQRSEGGTAGSFPCASKGLLPFSIARASSSVIVPSSTRARSNRTLPSFGRVEVVGVGHLGSTPRHPYDQPDEEDDHGHGAEAQ
jgi:hypothetical protein